VSGVLCVCVCVCAVSTAAAAVMMADDDTEIDDDTMCPPGMTLPPPHLSRLSQKLPEFDAHFMRLQILDKTPELRIHSTFCSRTAQIELKSQHAIGVI